MKKHILTGLGTALLMLAAISDAHAVVCARGVVRAGCATAGGAAVVRRPPPVVVAPRRPVVVAPARGCRYVNGRRVCG